MYCAGFRLFYAKKDELKIVSLYILLAATPLEASRGIGRRGKSRPHPILNLRLKRVKKYFWGRGVKKPSPKIV